MAERDPNYPYSPMQEHYFRSQNHSPEPLNTVGQRIKADKNFSSKERAFGTDESPKSWIAMSDTRKKLIYGHEPQDYELYKGNYNRHDLNTKERRMKPYSKHRDELNLEE